jgi:hypothetical protein
MGKKIEVEVAEAFGRTFVKGNIPEIHPVRCQPLQETRTKRTRHRGRGFEGGASGRLHRGWRLHDGLPDQGHFPDEQV